MLSVVIPFCGFYCTHLDAEFDDAMRDMFRDDDGDAREALSHHLDVEWHDAQTDCAKAYASHFADAIGVKLAFEKLDSPKEYNFETDRIFCTMEESEARRIRDLVDAEALDRIAEERHTSRAGFFSFYSPDVDTWGHVSSWEPEQLHTLLLAWMATGDCDETELEDIEYQFIEDCSGNGRFDEWTFAHSTNGQRLDRINTYLNAREARTA